MENVVIIGGGPAGLAAATYLGRAGLSPLVFAGFPAGGQLTLTSEVENYPGFEPIMGAELIQKMTSQAKKFGAKIVEENVVKVDFLDGGTSPPNSSGSLKSSKQVFSLFTQNNNFYAKSVIIATGAKALWLGLESEKRLQGKGVSACAVCDGFFFRDKVVAVVGGGDTAMEEALTLTKFAKKVYLIHRRDSFRASKIMQERVFNNKKIEVIFNTIVEDIIGKNKVEAVKLKSQNSNLKSTPKILNLEGVFIAIGHRPDTEIFKDQVELDERGYVITTNRIAQENLKLDLKIENSIKIENLKLKIPKFDFQYQYQTSVKGVFAAGDCVDFQYRQAATAAGMGVAAALEIERYLESA